MSYRYLNVKRYKRGAKWENGKPRYCTRCGYEGGRRRQANTTAWLQYVGTPSKVPVAYCEIHIPEDL